LGSFYFLYFKSDQTLSAKREVSFLPFPLAVFLAGFARPGMFQGEGKENSLNSLKTKGRI